MDKTRREVNLVGLSYSGGSNGFNVGCEQFLENLPDVQPDLFANESAESLHFNVLENIKVSEDIDCASAHGIFAKRLQELDIKNFHVFIGGDHSISLPAIIDSKRRNEITNAGDLGILIFDAHADMCSSTDNPTHEDWLRYLIDHGEILDQNIYIVGLRDLEPREFEYLRDKKVHTYFMKDIYERGVQDLCRELVTKLSKHKHLYCSIDIDSIDPSAAPATGYPSPGGLTTRELIYLLHQVKKIGIICGIDLVEINPTKDTNNMTTETGRKILAEIA